jgi:hypothetical protein
MKFEVGPVTPATVTFTAPVLAAAGTTAVIWVSPQLVIEAVAPLNCRVLLLCTDPKPLPLTTTVAPTGPFAGASPVTVGAPSTVNETPLLVTPKWVTHFALQHFKVLRPDKIRLSIVQNVLTAPVDLGHL